MWHRILHLLFPTYTKHGEGHTVRFTFPFLAVTALFAGLAAVTTTQDVSYISITTEPSSVKEGETFMIDVKAYAHTPVNAIDITLEYPDDQMVIEGIDTGNSVITLWAEDPYAKDGKVFLRGGVFQKGFLGEHPIARVRARATKSGLAYVNVDSVSLIAGDGKGTEVSVEKVKENETRVAVSNADGSLVGEAAVSLITDLDGDGKVDLADISAFMAAWFSRGKTFDFNGDGRMTFRDFSILLADSFFR